jgi:hypothetical protein
MWIEFYSNCWSLVSPIGGIKLSSSYIYRRKKEKYLLVVIDLIYHIIFNTNENHKFQFITSNTI